MLCIEFIYLHGFILAKNSAVQSCLCVVFLFCFCYFDSFPFAFFSEISSKKCDRIFTA